VTRPYILTVSRAPAGGRFSRAYDELAMGRIRLARDIEAWVRVHRPDQADIDDLGR
jgi:hypothetical protein